jgi:isopentenyl-diphosphate Delta-isomerase
MVENIIVVNEFDKEIGSVEKMEAHYNGILHRAFSILIFNSKNEILLQKRNMNKYHSPGLWTNTCCSHPRYGENLQDATYRRLQEEMGFTCELKEIFSFLYRAELENNLVENEYDHVFFGIYDGKVVINKDEADDYKWININDVKSDIKDNPEVYTYWFKVLFDRAESEFYKYLEEKSL